MSASLRREELVYGFGPAEPLVAVEVESSPSDSASTAAESVPMTLYFRHGHQLESHTESFQPFLWLTDPALLRHLEPSPTFMRLAGDHPLRWLVRFGTWAQMEHALTQLRKTTGRTAGDPSAPYMAIRDPVQQFLLASGRTAFHSMNLADAHVLYISIETACAPDREESNAARPEDRILSIALSDGAPDGDGAGELLLSATDMDEKTMLQHFVKEMRRRDPDLVIGHDLFRWAGPYLFARARRHRVPMKLGRDGSVPISHESRFSAAEHTVAYTRFHIYGRHAVDTSLLAMTYDASHRSLESHALHAVARHFGVAAAESSASAISALRETAAITPILLSAMFAQAGILPLPLEQICLRGNAGKIELLLLREYLRAGHSLPAPQPPQPFEGAVTDVFLVGLARPVWHCDVRSLYPSLLLLENRSPKNDPMGVFLLLLEQLRAFRLDAKQKALATDLTSAEISRWDALQTTFKILINSFYGYLAYPQARFNDYDLAADVTRRGRQLLRHMLEQLRILHAIPVEMDTDGIYFIPPDSARATPTAVTAFHQAFRQCLPSGIEVEFDGVWPAMYSYKMKNYALLHTDGTVQLKGAAFKSRGMEPYLRDFLRQWLTLTLQDRSAEIPPMLSKLRASIAAHTLPLSALAKTERLADSLENYSKKRAAAARSRQPAYEVALASGRPFQAGDTLSYYVTGTRKNIPVHAAARLLPSASAPAAPRDENTAFYLAKLDLLAKKLDASSSTASSNPVQPTLF